MKKGIALVICLGIIAFIWHNSLQDASLSDSRSLAVLALVRKVMAHLGIEHAEAMTNHIVRKAAHVCEYFLLGNALRLVGHYLWRRASAWTLVLGVCIASIDEYLQLFSPGRGAQVRDVGIDMCGVIVGCFVMSGLIWVWRKKDIHEI